MVLGEGNKIHACKTRILPDADDFFFYILMYLQAEVNKGAFLKNSAARLSGLNTNRTDYFFNFFVEKTCLFSIYLDILVRLKKRIL